jgi:hypothetical protein
MKKIVQLPLLIDINSKSEDSIIRLCLKLLISIIFKGQNSSANFQAQHQFTNGQIPATFQSVFKQQGVQEQAEMAKVLQGFQGMI